MSNQWNSLAYSGSRLSATLQAAEVIVREYGTSLLMRKMARDIADQQMARTPHEEARAVQIWIHDRVRYRRDPRDAELIQDPVTTIKNGGDCDDMAILAAALLRAIGHDARVATVEWQGRGFPSHAVAADLTAGLIVDPVAKEWPEQWPPRGFAVKEIRYLNDQGESVPLSGLFSKLVKSIAKPFQKIFPAKTFVGKLVDPLGLTDPSRNLNLVGRVADVVGTAAAVVAGGWAIGAATAGTAGGFWATTAAGASATGSALGTAGSAIGGALGKTVGTLAVAALLGKQKAGVALTPAEQAQLGQYYTDQGTLQTGYPGAGGGGGGGVYYDPSNPLSGNSPQAAMASPSSFPVVPVAIAVGLIAILATRKKTA